MWVPQSVQSPLDSALAAVFMPHGLTATNHLESFLLPRQYLDLESNQWPRSLAEVLRGTVAIDLQRNYGGVFVRRVWSRILSVCGIDGHERRYNMPAVRES